MSISILKFVDEAVKYIYNKNQKLYYNGADNLTPNKYLNLYNNVPEFSSSINFILDNLIVDGIEELDYFTLKKICFDYILQGQFYIETQKLRNGKFKINHLDAEKCRYSGDLNQIGYAADWNYNYRQNFVFKPITDSVKNDGIFTYKAPLTKDVYGKPKYISALKQIETADEIANFHLNTAKNSFITSKVITFRNGVPTKEVQAEMEQSILENFGGSTGKRFMILYAENEADAPTITNLEDDQLDTKFESLQKFIQQSIIMAFSITSKALIGISIDNQGFNTTEFEQAMKIFKDTVIAGYRKEIEHGLSLLLNKDIKLITEIIPPKQETNIVNDNSINQNNQI